VFFCASRSHFILRLLAFVVLGLVFFSTPVERWFICHQITSASFCHFTVTVRDSRVRIKVWMPVLYMYTSHMDCAIEDDRPIVLVIDE